VGKDLRRCIVVAVVRIEEAPGPIAASHNAGDDVMNKLRFTKDRYLTVAIDGENNCASSCKPTGVEQ
jgi:hypothetical protein